MPSAGMSSTRNLAEAAAESHTHTGLQSLQHVGCDCQEINSSWSEYKHVSQKLKLALTNLMPLWVPLGILHLHPNLNNLLPMRTLCYVPMRSD